MDAALVTNTIQRQGQLAVACLAGETAERCKTDCQRFSMIVVIYIFSDCLMTRPLRLVEHFFCYNKDMGVMVFGATFNNVKF